MSTLSVGTIKSNTSAPPVIQNTSGTEIGTFCRAWVNFNGTTVTNPGSMTGVRASFNVSSITDNGVGDYTVNFTTAMPDANYIVSGTGSGATTNMLPITPADSTTARTSSSMRFVILASNGGSAVDCSQVGISIFR